MAGTRLTGSHACDQNQKTINSNTDVDHNVHLHLLNKTDHENFRLIYTNADCPTNKKSDLLFLIVCITNLR